MVTSSPDGWNRSDRHDSMRASQGAEGFSRQGVKGRGGRAGTKRVGVNGVNHGR